jgi:hypothetical protein
MKRSISSSFALFSILLGGCGPAELIVTAEVEVIDPETGSPVVRPVDDVELQLLPFDRDAIFDSLTAAAATPEPQLPAALQVARDSIVQAQGEWREFESRWLALRERLEQISAELEQYNPAEAQYRVLFNEFNDVEAEYANAERTKDAAFEQFDRLQQETFSELEEFRAVLGGWEDQAFGPFLEVAAAKVQASGMDVLVDTTDATGRADFQPNPGQWWIYGRYPFATEELYWNVPLTLERGGPVELRLNEDNAQVREIF